MEQEFQKACSVGFVEKEKRVIREKEKPKPCEYENPRGKILGKGELC